MIDKLLIGLTKVGFLRPFTRLNLFIFHTSPTTKGKVAAKQALVAKIKLGASKRTFLLTACDLIDGCFEDATESPFWIDEKIARIAVAVVFDHDVLAALLAECADSMPPG